MSAVLFYIALPFMYLLSLLPLRALYVLSDLLYLLLYRVFGYRNVVPLALGLTMFQAGEFAFVIGRVGVSTGSIDSDLYSGIMAVALVTMFLTPFLSRATAPIYGFIKSRRQIEPVHLEAARDLTFRHDLITVDLDVGDHDPMIRMHRRGGPGEIVSFFRNVDIPADKVVSELGREENMAGLV